MAQRPLWPTSVQTVLGVDEAGRGSVLGPLVVGGFAIARARLAELTELGVRDSKQLSPQRREELFERLPSLGSTFWIELPPSKIDSYVRRGQLNDLEARTFGELVRGANVEEAMVDACDVVAERFGRSVSRYARSAARILARHHADEQFPVVGAASIVAKVVRDRAMRMLSEAEHCDLGSGYPSDEITVEFLRRTLASGARFPTFVRASWATTARLMGGPAARPLESIVR